MPSDPRDFVQTEGTTVVDDTLNVAMMDILGGRLGGHGVIGANTVTIGPGGVLAPGNSPGVLTIDPGNLYIAGSLEIEIAGTVNPDDGPPQFDKVEVLNGKAIFAKGSSIQFIFYSAYTPTNGQEWEFLSAEQGLEGVYHLSYSTVGLSSAFGYQVYADGGDLYLRVYSVAQGVPTLDEGEHLLYSGQVPEPSTVALQILAFALLLILHMRLSYRRSRGGQKRENVTNA